MIRLHRVGGKTHWHKKDDFIHWTQALTLVIHCICVQHIDIVKYLLDIPLLGLIQIIQIKYISLKIKVSNCYFKGNWICHSEKHCKRLIVLYIVQIMAWHLVGAKTLLEPILDTISMYSFYHFTGLIPKMWRANEDTLSFAPQNLIIHTCCCSYLRKTAYGLLIQATKSFIL